MDKIYLDDFIQDINNIREYINYINTVNQLKKDTKHIKSIGLIKFNKQLNKLNRKKKLFEYKAIIISLYGILENTIAKWIQKHVQNISFIVSDYNRLEEKFRDEHFNLSIKIIMMINESRYSKFDNMDKESILKNLNQSIVRANDFELNSEVYIPMSGNLKHSKIVDAFKPLNIELNFLSTTLHREIIKIDDLVGRRNDIAHGVEIDDILAISEFEDFISVLEKYMTSIFNVVSKKEIEYEFEHQSMKYIDEPKEFFKKNTVCIVNIEDIEIKVGDRLFIEKANKVLIATILNIKKDNISVESANNGELGLELDIPIKKNSKVWKKELNQ